MIVETAQLLGLAAAVFVGNLTQTITGFGSMVVCVTLGAHLMPIPLVLALVLPLALAQNLYIVCRHHRAVDRRFLLRVVLPWMLPGAIAGWLLSRHVDATALRPAYAVLIIALSLHLLWLVSTNRTARSVGWLMSPLVFFAGVVHGIYATGGPLLVYGVGTALGEKAAVRATLTAVWLALNTFLVGSMVATGVVTGATLGPSALIFVALVGGIVVGEWLHHRVNERGFRAVNAVVLLAAALVLLFR